MRAARYELPEEPELFSMTPMPGAVVRYGPEEIKMIFLLATSSCILQAAAAAASLGILFLREPKQYPLRSQAGVAIKGTTKTAKKCT
jgi:hypothetical protein